MTVPMVRGSKVFYADTFKLVGNGGEGSCTWNGYTVWNAASYLITGSVTVKQGGKIDFFILNQTQFAKWTSSWLNGGNRRGGSCAVWRPTPPTDVAVLGITNYSVSYVVPDNANHTFVFFNAYIDDATVTVSLAW